MKVFQILRLLKNTYIPTWNSLKIRKELLKYPVIQDDNGPLILCQAFEDYLFAHRIIHFMLAYKELNKVRPNLGWIVPRKALGLKSWKDKVRFFFLNNSVNDYFWTSLYKSIGGHIAFRYCDSDILTEKQAIDWAKKIQFSLKSKEDLVALKIDGMIVGDLVYDTYLRYKPAPTVDISDPFLNELLVWTWSLYQQVNTYFELNKVSAVVATYTTYIQHGILVRTALKRNVPVYSLAVSNQLVVMPTKDFPFHKRNFHAYKDYLKHKNLEEARLVGKQILEDRMNGKVDAATTYMKTSPYSRTEIKNSIFGPSDRKRAVVMGHDFYDSPHIYGSMLFADFYEWIEFVFSESKKSLYDFYYKPHPNGLPENEEINEKLRKSYPHIKFIDKTVSNLSIIEEKIDIAFTVYGTVAHEFAYRGIPVISAGDNPHQIYKFNLCAKSKAELAEYIHGTKIPILDNSEITEFCFVHTYRQLDGSMSQFPYVKNIMSEQFSQKGLSARVASMKEGIQKLNEL